MEETLRFPLSIQRVHIPWRQIASAFILSLCLLGIYLIILQENVRDTEVKMREDFVPVSGERTEAGELYDTKDMQNVLGTINGHLALKLQLKTRAEETNLPLVPDARTGLKRPGKAEVPSLSSAQTTAKDEAKIEEIPVQPEVSSTEMTVIFNGNGGTPAVSELSCSKEEFAEGKFDAGAYSVPSRLGKVFDGWYIDPDCTVLFTGMEGGKDRLELYAGWKEFPGFLSDDRGYIIGYTDAGRIMSDGMIALPTHESCIGIARNAFAGLEEEIEDIYIPGNITAIEDGVFEDLYNLIYIEVASANPIYKSKDGILYKRDGTLTVVPKGRGEM